ncbi:hypothetical protein LMG28688_00942 [Paraburkholderia caffeinitolerans]|uniref:DUF1835 domain-containing protein n=1 Tax=Paraburkholderia caffeinitolerans TaxID=1723730 RepID=A0A6J5FGQ3_9BURK|nr:MULTISPECIES: DUF1835 domain-containing protein [Paraburkholderia]CAB3779988.1 hypothetical protein LMG28688_00942 [Paraburkholderia caffeinitolerans]
MTTIHLIHGEPAAAALLQALEAREASRGSETAGAAGTAAHVIALADDLTAGPLRDIDEAGDPGAAQRAAFWQRLGGVSETLVQDDCMALAALEADDSHVVIWHTPDAADQLALRRACYRLRNAPQRLNEVRLAAGDLAGPPDATAARLLAHLPDAAPISVLRITRLALEWQEAKFANGEMRRWRNNTFTSGTWADLDTLILEILGAATLEGAHARPGTAGTPWLACDTLGAALVRRGAGFTVGEPLVLWRLRELATAGELRLRDDMCVARASAAESCAGAAAHGSRAARPSLPHTAAHLSFSR